MNHFVFRLVVWRHPLTKKQYMVVNTATEKKKLARRNTKKRRRKTSKQKSASVSTGEIEATLDAKTEEAPTKISGRDFSNDLLKYIEAWEIKSSKSSSVSDRSWKFNKVLQTWGVSNMLDKEKLNSSLFKRFCPYVASIQGEIRNRILTNMNEVIQKYEEQKLTTGSELTETGPPTSSSSSENVSQLASLVPEIVYRRALKVIKLLT